MCEVVPGAYKRYADGIGLQIWMCGSCAKVCQRKAREAQAEASLVRIALKPLYML